MFTLNQERIMCDRPMKDVFGETLVELGKTDSRIVGLDADLMRSGGMSIFRKAFPDRTFNCGIQEADMVGIACGLSGAGAIPFTHTFAAFAGRKTLDQVFLGGCYADRNVKLIGTDPGITSCLNGGTHMGMEDMGVFLNYKNLTLLEPSDAVMLKDLLRQQKDIYGMFYTRIHRKEQRTIYREGSTFTIGKGNVLRRGRDITVIASGIEVYEALEAAEILQQKGIDAGVIDMFTWSPIDEELITEAAGQTGAIVVAENHFIRTGLGSAIAKVVCERKPVPMGFIGVDDFGEVGSLDYLLKRYHMTALDIADKAETVLRMKA